MYKTMYGIRSVAKHFKITRDVIRDLMFKEKIHPEKQMLGPTMMWVFEPKDLKEIEKVLEKKQAARLSRAA